jgi:hypothetical protein
MWPIQGREKRLGPATTLYGTLALSFVIPPAPASRGSEAEGSVVPRNFPGNAESRPTTNLSSRLSRRAVEPEHSVVERSAVFLSHDLYAMTLVIPFL